MAQTGVSTSASFLRFNSLSFALNPSSCSQPQSFSVSLPSQRFPSRRLKKLAGNRKGSAIAGALGGLNAYASNIFFLFSCLSCPGQDPAQNIESSHYITMMEAIRDGKDLHVSVTMPSIEVGTVGGETQLASQSACSNLLGVKGANREAPGANTRQLASIVAALVLAGELSLTSAIAAGQLVNNHMKCNRPSKDVSALVSA